MDKLTLNDALGAIPAQHRRLFDLVDSLDRVALDSPAGVACLQLNGKGANQVVMHYHLHLMPRLMGKNELPVTTWELKQGDMDAIKHTAEKLAAMIS